MKLIIAGPRDVPHEEAIKLVVAAFEKFEHKDDVTQIVHGGCRGIDLAADEVFQFQIERSIFLPDWNQHGKAAGPIRNQQMAEHADALLAIWDGRSRGTGNMIKTAKKMGLIVHVHRFKR